MSAATSATIGNPFRSRARDCRVWRYSGNPRRRAFCRCCQEALGNVAQRSSVGGQYDDFGTWTTWVLAARTGAQSRCAGAGVFLQDQVARWLRPREGADVARAIIDGAPPPWTLPSAGRSQGMARRADRTCHPAKSIFGIQRRGLDRGTKFAGAGAARRPCPTARCPEAASGWPMFDLTVDRAEAFCVELAKRLTECAELDRVAQDGAVGGGLLRSLILSDDRCPLFENCLRSTRLAPRCWA